MKYNTSKKTGIWLGGIIGLFIFAFCIWGIDFSLTQNDAVLKIMLLIPAFIFLGMFIFVLINGLAMNYYLSSNGMEIRWGLRRKFIPWEEINEIIRIKGKSNLFSILGISWPGYTVGLYNIRGLGPARMYATDINQGFLYLKTSKGFFGITPKEIEEVARLIAEKSGKEIQYLDMDTVPEETKGKIISEDSSYRLLYILNIILLLAFALYLGIFFPGSGASRFIILLLVLAIGLFFFNTSNAARLFQFSHNGGYALLILGIIVTGTFFILSLVEISL
ncbi:PH domain-containing protein [Thermosyntropha lipolytica DSM 11003]|uniref:PH domain-containing protein n=1 Tax=Thermosyntropha lipolytica DSM 11003 TaxID=1123382 RepID=A0A1M5LB96_9FIRM|nr:PH domain-containing protein [Thermosyntropha lipolytica]SHG62287.1 PH domain-containing protein [Thermosyntropha lipolytica DSM 11003]